MEKPPKVLVVDDDPAILEICTDMLETEGFDVAVASNGQQALDQIRDDAKPSLVLMDIMMPVMDGVTTCRQMKNDPLLARIPVVLMSARTNLSPANKELAVADALVPKPFDIDYLLNTIHSLVYAQ